MSDTAYPPNVPDVSAKVGSLSVGLQLAVAELNALSTLLAGNPGGPSTSGTTVVQGATLATSGTPAPATGSSSGTLGTSSLAARADHAHPTDGSRASAAALSSLAGSLSAVAFSGAYSDLSGKPAGGGTGTAAPASALLLGSDGSSNFATRTVGPGLALTGSALDISAATKAGLIQSSVTSGTTTTITRGDGSTLTIVGAQGGQGVPGQNANLGTGALVNNAMSISVGGPDVPAGVFHSRRRSTDQFGTQNNTTTVASMLQTQTRAALVAWKNTSGFTPYAFMADYPVSQGDDICVFVPPGNTSATTTVHLTQNYTLPVARPSYTLTDANGNVVKDGNGNPIIVPAYGGPVGLYTGVDGYSYLYVSDVADVSRTFTYNQPISDTGGKLAAGSIVLSTQGNCIRITTQPSGTTLGTGAVITVGTPPTSSMVGQQVFAPQGLKAPRNRSNPFPKITAANPSAGTITLSSPLYVSTQSYTDSGGGVHWTDGNTYQQQITGLQPLSVLYIFTPVAEANICSTMFMDDLAFLAACFNSRTGDQSHDVVYLSAGDHYQGVPWYLWDVTCSILGAHSQTTYIRMCCSSYAVLSYFPRMTAIGKIGGFSIYPSDGTKTQHAGLYIEGAGETQPILNNLQDIKISFEVSDISTGGPVQGVRLRHIGGEWLDNLTHVGKDLTTLNPSATLVCHNVVYARVGRLGAQNCGAAWLWEGYGEHGIIENGGDVSCASFFDNDLASTVNGVGMLIMEVKGTDMDVQFFGGRFAYIESLVMVGQEVQFPNPPRAMLPGRSTAPIITIEGCIAGEVAHVFGGAAVNGQTDLIQVKARSMNGGAQGTSGIKFSHLTSSLAATLRIDAGCNGNRIFDSTIDGTIVDNGNNTHDSGSSGGAAASPSLAADTIVNAYINSSIPVAAISASNGTNGTPLPLGVDEDPGSNASGSGSSAFAYVAKRAGHYEFELRADFATAGTGGAYPAGTQLGLSVGTPFTNNPARRKTADPYNNTVEYVSTFYLGQGQSIQFYAYSDVATTLNFAHLTVRQVSI